MPGSTVKTCPGEMRHAEARVLMNLEAETVPGTVKKSCQRTSLISVGYPLSVKRLERIVDFSTGGSGLHLCVDLFLPFEACLHSRCASLGRASHDHAGNVSKKPDRESLEKYRG